MAESAIEFEASVYKVQTLVDGGLRVTLDLPEDAIADAAALMDCKRKGFVLKIAISVLSGLTNGKNKTDPGTARNTPRVVGG